MAVKQATLIEVLHGVPLFSMLSGRQLRGIARECSEVHYEPGDVLMRELDAGQHMITIISGTADVVRGGTSIATVGPGDAVGEMSLIDDEPRSAAVVASEPVTALVLYRTVFRKLLADNPSMCTKLLHAQTQRLREHDKRAAATG
jgi:CRP/FNR family transcriptional regulator, cyclic AMP receptor protein